MPGMILAQEATDIAADLVGTWTPLVLIVAPILIGLLTKITSEENAKKGIAAFLAVAIAGVMIFLDPPETLSLPIIMARLAQGFPMVEGAYRLWNALLAPLSGGKRLNELTLPGVGKQFGDATQAVQVAYDDIQNRRNG